MSPRSTILIAALCVGACSSSPQPGAPAAAPDPVPPPASVPPAPLTQAPWTEAPLRIADVPQPYITQWRRAANRMTCALIAPADVGSAGAGAVARAATFSGGWAVAYDTPSLRSAFGVAGTGSRASDDAYSDWPHEVRWRDGSSAGYGPEGGSGPNQLAYLRIAGQDCLYNVWSRLGVAHLKHILSQLRFVRTDG